MSFVVSARKYRPTNFDDLIGQDHIATTLKNAIKNDKLAHAFLFSGPRGVGKTTSARILAKVLNCQSMTKDYHACGSCSACKSFEDNASFNIFELDAASNNSVEHIRALNDQVRFQPQQGTYKIYIIDEVHMLSQTAFNAFLKTLEEPPPYAKFILATTEKHKIIPTILSRCQIFDFKRIQIKDIVVQLEKIALQEERTFDEDSLHLIAQKADGAMRDALSIYDKVVSSIEGDVSYTDVAESLNILDHDYHFKVVDAAIKEDLTGLMMIIDDITKKGFEPEQFILGLMEHLRNLLLVKDLTTAAILEVGENLIKRYENQAQLTNTSFLLTALSILDKTDISLLRSQNKRLSIEIAISKIAYMNRAVDKKKTTDPAAGLTAQPSNPATDKTITKAKIQKPKAVTAAPAKESLSDLVSAVYEDSSEAISDNKEPENKAAIHQSQTSQTRTPAPGQTPTPPFEVAEPKDSKAQSPQKESTSKSVSTKSVKPKPPKKTRLKLSPTLTTNIDDLTKQIEQEEEEIRNINNPYSKEHIQAVLLKWKEASKSNSFKAAIDHTVLQLDGETVKVYTPAQIYVDMLKQQLDMIEEIHAMYPDKDLTFSFEVNMDAFPNYEPPKKTRFLSTIEKYDMFKKKNPAFELLVDTLKLKPNA